MRDLITEWTILEDCCARSEDYVGEYHWLHTGETRKVSRTVTRAFKYPQSNMLNDPHRSAWSNMLNDPHRCSWSNMLNDPHRSA